MYSPSYATWPSFFIIMKYIFLLGIFVFLVGCSNDVKKSKCRMVENPSQYVPFKEVCDG